MQSPVFTFIGNNVACFGSNNDFNLFRLFYVFIVRFFLIDFYIVNNHLRIFFELRSRVRIARPVTADSNIQNQIKILVIRSRKTYFSKSVLFSEPVVYFIIHNIINVKTHFARFPLYSKNVELIRKISFGQFIAFLFLSMRFSKMKRSVKFVCLISENFHYVNFAAFWPLTVKTFVSRHHPERRQKSLSLRNFKPGFKSAVSKLVLACCIYSS